MCRKIRYRSEIDALLALNEVIRRREQGKENRKECRYYRCPYCRGWHLTKRETWDEEASA